MCSQLFLFFFVPLLFPFYPFFSYVCYSLFSLFCLTFCPGVFPFCLFPTADLQSCLVATSAMIGDELTKNGKKTPRHATFFQQTEIPRLAPATAMRSVFSPFFLTPRPSQCCSTVLKKKKKVLKSKLLKYTRERFGKNCNLWSQRNLRTAQRKTRKRCRTLRRQRKGG